MEGKWTKGEWAARIDEAVTVRDAYDNQLLICTNIRTRTGGRRDPDEVAANARLIAQAPAMAEALEDAQKRLRGAGMLGGADDPVNVVLTAIKGE